jgi:uncharacterized membrane protein YphA (DoxX/SURF4 family)
VGGPGVGLLLLRATVGVTALVQGVLCLLPAHQAAHTWILGLLAILTGASLLVGLLTPVAAILAAIGSVCVAVGLTPHTPLLLVDWRIDMLIALVGVSVALLGPGAFSIDARLFGRREIIIPHDRRTVRS